MNHKLKIHWMHCISCEVLLEQNLKELDWVEVISVNHKNWDVVIKIKDEWKISEIEEVINKMNYTIEWKPNSWENSNSNKSKDYIEIILSFIIISGLVYFFNKLNLLDKLPITTSNAWILVALLLWIVASVSTCLALLWWLVISFWSTISETENEKTLWEKARPHIYFNLWRIIWFSILWWILWFIWKKLIMSPSINWIMTMIIAVIMFYIWLQILNFVPSITKLWFHLPKAFTRNIQNLSKSNHWLIPVIIWVLTFFIPCWFTQSMQLASVESWSMIIWALTMWAFALWTAPVLFSLWFWSSYIQKSNFGLLKKIIWVLIIFFALFSFTNGFKLWVDFMPNSTELSSDISSNGQGFDFQNENAQTINFTHNWRSLEPYSVLLKHWTKYKLEIMPQANGQWCMFSMLIPWLDRTVKDVVKGKKIIYEISPVKSWVYPIVCGAMWMDHGKLIIE